LLCSDFYLYVRACAVDKEAELSTAAREDHNMLAVDIVLPPPAIKADMKPVQKALPNVQAMRDPCKSEHYISLICNTSSIDTSNVDTHKRTLCELFYAAAVEAFGVAKAKPRKP
jgi:hypothetical protein